MPDPTIQAEEYLIGSALITSGRIIHDLDIDAADFAAPKHEALWRLIHSMVEAGEATDLATVGAALTTADPTLKRQADPAWLATVVTNTITPANADHYATIVRDAATRRRLHQAATKIVQAIEDTEDITELIDTARAAVDQASRITTTGALSFGETFEQTLSELTTDPRYEPTPWQDLNHLIGGWRPGCMYVIGARPGSGKTLVALQAALGLTTRGAVAFCSLEMNRGELHKRVFAQQARVNLGRLVNSDLTSFDWERLTGHRDQWANLPLYVNDDPGMNTTDIRAFARTVNRRQPLAAIVVDYLQLMEPKQTRKGANRQEEVARMSRQLKILAKEFDVPVLALSQLNRESARGQMPGLSDLRESGAIEQDADVVILLHRGEDSSSDVLNVLVAKNRHGMRAPLELQWEGHYARVADKEFRPAVAS